MEPNTLSKLQEWYRVHCDGFWEHKNGITITTSDNPAWNVSIDLDGTGFLFKSATYVSPDYDTNREDWCTYQFDETTKRFDGTGDPSKLDFLLNAFLDTVATGSYEMIDQSVRNKDFPSVLSWDGQQWLSTVDPNWTNGATFDSYNIPTQMSAGASASITVSFRNGGTSTWTQIALYRLGSQGPRDNTVWGLNRVFLGAEETIAPGQLKKFTFNITAPTTPGTYSIQWQMLKDDLEWFGVESPLEWIKVI